MGKLNPADQHTLSTDIIHFTQDHFVRLFYRNDEHEHADLMKFKQIKGERWSKKDVPWDEFLRVTEDYVIKNRDEECAV